MKPSIGRIVHYYSVMGSPLAGIITGHTSDTVVDLSVFQVGRDGAFSVVDAPFSEEPKPGHWSWPPRV